MPHRYGTARRSFAIVLIAIVGVILGLFAANPLDQETVAGLLLGSLVIIVPLHFAIEGNRRDAISINTDWTSPPISHVPRSRRTGRHRTGLSVGRKW